MNLEKEEEEKGFEEISFRNSIRKFSLSQRGNWLGKLSAAREEIERGTGTRFSP